RTSCARGSMTTHAPTAPSDSTGSAQSRARAALGEGRGAASRSMRRLARLGGGVDMRGSAGPSRARYAPRSGRVKRRAAPIPDRLRPSRAPLPPLGIATLALMITSLPLYHAPALDDPFGPQPDEVDAGRSPAPRVV